MSYTRQQIEDTVSYILEDAFRNQPSKIQQFLNVSLTNIFNRLTKSNPSETKFALDKRDPHLFSDFFEWLKDNEVSFPNTRYILKRNGESVADHNGHLTMIVKKPKASSRQHSEHYNEIIDALRELRLGDDESISLDDEPYYAGAFNADGFDRDGYDKNGYDCDGYDEDGYDRNGYDYDGYDEDGYDQDGFDENGYNIEGYNCDGFDEDGYNSDGLHKTSLSNDSTSEELSSEEEPCLVVDTTDTAREVQEQKERATLTFEHSNRGKSSRSLYHEAKHLAQIKKEESNAKTKAERTLEQPTTDSAVKRFAGHPEKILKTLPVLHGYNGYKAKCGQVPGSVKDYQSKEVSTLKLARMS